VFGDHERVGVSREGFNAGSMAQKSVGQV